MSKKRKIVVTCLAIVLAVSLAVGGTITYLTGSSGEVKNEFTKNKNGVELDETTGSEYEIVPGTSQDKDPTITATYTLDSYVFVEVTDATEDLVTWYIANGWALLSTTNSTDGSTTYVYYQLLEAEDTSNWTEVTYTNASSYEDGSNHVGEYVYVDATTGVTYYYDSSTGTYTALIHVLEGDKVYYDSSITNADIDSAGDISLTFEAHIIQAEPFLSGNNNVVADGAEAAYLAMLGNASAYAAAGYSAMVNGKLYTDLNSAMTAALNASATNNAAVTVDVVANTSLGSALVLDTSGADITLNLNGNSITYDSSTSGNTTTYSSLICVESGANLTITGDGTIDGTGMDADTELIWARGGTVIIENGTFIHSTLNEAVVYASTPSGSTSVGTVEIYGGTFKNTASGSYAYGNTLSPLTLNVWNGESGTGYNDQGVSSGDITVYGGTFYGNSPASGDDNLSNQTAGNGQRAVTTFVADGYSVHEVTGTPNAYVVYKSGEAVTISGLSVSNALTALSSISSAGNTTGAVTIEAAEDSSVSATDLQTAVSSNDVTIDLNETELTISNSDAGGIDLSNTELYISDGTVSYTSTYSNASNRTVFSLEENGGLTLENVTLNTNAPINVESGTNNAEINIINSTINSTNYYAVSTNAADLTSGANVVINIENSVLSVVDGVDSSYDSAAILFNIPGTLNITDSTITGQRQGVIVRCGTANITDSTVTTTAEYTGNLYYQSSNWGSGNEVPMAALVVGNRVNSNSYPYAATANLSNVTLTVRTSSSNVLIPSIYAATNGYATTVTGASSTDTVLVDLTNAFANGNSGSVSINGTTVSSSISSLTKVSDITGTN
ncbi:MAG: hypothetical protein LUD44_06035 [Firmicutes bacterium]|nr:hypothetical protein [Bacillota bacterium]